jgi:hypothetical protein
VTKSKKIRSLAFLLLFPSHLTCSSPLSSFHCLCCRGLSHFVPLCECSGVVSATQRIKDAIVDVSLSRRYDLFPYVGYPTLTAIDFEAGYLDLCSKMLDHIQCPPAHQCMRGNYIPGNYSTWIGLCICNYQTSCQSLEKSFLATSLPYLLEPQSQSSFTPVHSTSTSHTLQERVITSDPHIDFSIRIAKNIFDAILKPNYQLLLVQSNTSSTSAPAAWDLCGSYYNICSFFLQKIACPAELQYSTPCGQEYNSTSPHYHPETGDYLYPHGKIQNATAYCRCGMMNVLDAKSFELVVTGLLSDVVNEEYTYLPSPVAPYSLAISSNPYKQLIQARQLLPL